MLRVLLETMPRMSEFVSLQVEDISFEEDLIILGNGKGGKRREVPITNSLARELKLHVGGRNTGALFLSPKEGGYSTRRIQQIVKETAKKAEITKRVYPHLLRHTMATRLVNGEMRSSTCGRCSATSRSIRRGFMQKPRPSRCRRALRRRETMMEIRI